jgi:hypothetical protein
MSEPSLTVHPGASQRLQRPGTLRYEDRPGRFCSPAFFALDSQVNNALVDFYRCPEELATFSSPEKLRSQPGYFSFGPGAVCYGQTTVSSPAILNGASLPDLAGHVASHGSTIRLPFNVSTIVDNLRLERYPTNGHAVARSLMSSEAVRRVYYGFRPMLTASFRKTLQRLYLRDWDKLAFPTWPVDTSVEQTLERILLLSMRAGKVKSVPFIWFWPDGAPSSAIVTHDVETNVGLNFVPRLMDVDDAFSVKSAFQLVPEERYKVSNDLLGAIRGRHCEINVHGLNHDGNLFRDRKTFLRHAKWINRYVLDYGAEGFRSACMYRNVEWYEDLNISYDMSVPNVAHLEPQRGGCCTVFPYFIGRILELPLTTIQDYSLFHILGDYSIDLWKKQIELITEKHGLISFIAHPDYLVDKKALSVYEKLLDYLSQLRSERNVWIARPSDINRWWRERSALKLVLEERKWRIKGPGRERARIGFACIENDRIVYTVQGSCEAPAEHHG